ncbi:MAG: biotin synthase BioB [Planctomycetota bacterium]
MDERLSGIGERAVAGEGATPEEASWLEVAPFEELLFWAGRARRARFGNRVSLCGIVNARSGLCGEDCRFCAQSARYATGVKTYPLLEPGAILAAAEEAHRNGASCFGIVTSGAAPKAADLAAVARAVRRIKQKLPVEVSASLGRLDATSLTLLREAGLDRYHHNLETSERFFPSLCSTHTHAERAATVRAAGAAGLRVCSGGLLGAGEAWQDRVSLAMALRGLRVESVPLNFLHPVPGTPLAGTKPLPPREILRIIALFRLALPAQEIRVCGGRGVALRDLQALIFQAGASGMMVGNYLTTPGRAVEEDLRMLSDLGLEWQAGCGSIS